MNLYQYGELLQQRLRANLEADEQTRMAQERMMKASIEGFNPSMEIFGEIPSKLSQIKKESIKL